MAGRGRPPDPERRSARKPAGAKTTVAYKFVSPEDFSVLDIAVVRGRASRRTSVRPTLSVAIVSEATALALWPHADALGQVVRLDPDSRPNRSERDVSSPPQTSRPSSRERSRWSASSGTSQDSGSHPSSKPWSTCRRVPRCPRPRSSPASTAIPNWHGRRFSID